MDQIFQVHLQIGDIITNYFHKPWVSFANTFKTFNCILSFFIQTFSYQIQSKHSNYLYSGHQTSNGAQLGGTSQIGGYPQIVPFKVNGTKHY